ncbi:MAG: hypothetical protein BRC22_02225 [Parcubacteria group bacterium QH_9_35_7]|nr:MAG: hypothetical protein BRC22_02225 [Parcubacteria group bacterium QH_9_35_7]
MNKKSLTKFNSIGLILTALAASLAWLNIQEIIALIIVSAFFFYLGASLGNILLTTKKLGVRLLIGALISVGLYIIILSVIYWFFQINKTIVASIITILGLVIFVLNYLKKIKFDFYEKINKISLLKKYCSKKNFLLILIILSYSVIFGILFTHRSGGTIISPWIPLSWKFFSLFFLINSLLIYFLQNSRQKAINYFLLVLNFGVFLWIALIIYKHGFGFDPFIHQATEKWIAKKGVITPKKPYYIGQYVLVVSLYFLTNISIHIIDSALVPVFAAILIPSCLYFFVKKENYNSYVTIAVALLPTLLLSQFIVTTPNNLALLFAFILIFWCWFEWDKENKLYYLVGTILSITSIAIHPFIGLPSAVFYFGSLAYRKFDLNKRISLGLYFITGTLFLPFILGLYIYLTQSGTVVNPFANFEPFLNIFKSPHWYLFEQASWPWQILYSFKVYIWKYLLILVALFGFWKVETSNKSIFYATSALAIFMSSFLLATGLNFSKVISYEETVFANRILDLALLILAPGLLAGFFNIIKFIKLPKKTVFLSIGCSLLLLFSLYFTYPSRDPIYQYTGYNVRTADLKAVEFINNRNKNDNYIVIANQMIGAAALKKFGFKKYIKLKNNSEHYFYSIPTGGALYKKFFSKMVYEKPKRKWMKQAMKFAGVKKAYFVHTNYWYPAAKIRDQAKKSANNWWEFGGGKVWLYEYKK